MNVLQYAGSLYSLDTLDTRFTSSSKTPPSKIDPARPSTNQAGRASTSKRSDAPGGRNQTSSKSRWRTPEYMYHGLVFLIAIPLMFKTAYDLSQPSRPEYSRFAPLLSSGWIPGRKVDNSDQQYASFRDNVPYLIIVMVLHPILRRAYENLSPPLASSSNRIGNQYDGNKTSLLDAQQPTGESRLSRRISFDVGFSILFLLVLHGISALKVLAILCINYSIAKHVKREYMPVVTWVFNIGILFANELGEGYPLGRIADAILPGPTSLDNNVGPASKANWGTVLDRYGGLIPRWEILFNVTVLRLVSFNLDYFWSLHRIGGSPIEKKQLDPASLSERDRVNTPAKAPEYSFRNYLAYSLYSPLYLAGPILTFNDYISQQLYTPQSITKKRTMMYGIRFLLSFLVMEVMIHYIYVIAISKAQPAWEVYTPFQLSMLGYFSLHHIWLKLLLPWRFFRLWSLLDGVDPPENVVRCMSDNYSAFAFWRGWHRSFGRWTIRYIYIPLGGSGGPGTRGKYGQVRGLVNLLIVFTFVAIWHDIQLRLLVWGWLISLFVLPETIATMLFPQSKWQNHKETYRILCGVGAVGNILMMMSANLVGFAVGLDGLKGLVQGIIGSNTGLLFLSCACAALFSGAQVMFELREQELRQGINIRC